MASISGAVSALVVNGGTVELGSASDDSKALGSDITVNKGGELVFNNSSILNDGVTGRSITVDGGVLNFGNTRQYLNAGWGITLKNDATLKGAGTKIDGTNLAAALDFSTNQVSSITAESGQNVISADICLRNGSSLSVEVVDEKASLFVSGRIHSGAEGTDAGTLGKDGAGTLSLSSPAQFKWISQKNGKLALAGGSSVETFHVEKNGGTLQLSGDVQIGKLRTRAGILSLTSTDDVEKQVDTLDGSMNNTAEGTLRLEGKTKLQISKEFELNTKASIELAKGSELKHKGLVLTNTMDETAVLEASDNGKQYSHELTEYSLENGYVKVLDDASTYSDTGEVRMRNQLVNTAVENAGDCMLKVWNSQNSLSGVHATGASIQLFEQEAHHLQELSVGNDLEVSAFKDVNGSMDQLATLHVEGTAGFGSGITLNANLVMGQGAVVTLADTVNLEGTLTLQAGLMLDGAVLEEIAGLEEGESYTLFRNVDGLNVQSLQQTVALYNMRSLAAQTNEALSYRALMDGEQAAAADYFSNLAGDRNLVLSYKSSEGTVRITHAQAVPEPTTATLSLLALAGLCARRRRK